MWHITQSDPFPFIVRWRVYSPDKKYVATFRNLDEAIQYVDFRMLGDVH